MRFTFDETIPIEQRQKLVNEFKEKLDTLLPEFEANGGEAFFGKDEKGDDKINFGFTINKHLFDDFRMRLNENNSHRGVNQD